MDRCTPFDDVYHIILLCFRLGTPGNDGPLSLINGRCTVVPQRLGSINPSQRPSSLFVISTVHGGFLNTEKCFRFEERYTPVSLKWQIERFASVCRVCKAARSTQVRIVGLTAAESPLHFPSLTASSNSKLATLLYPPSFWADRYTLPQIKRHSSVIKQPPTPPPYVRCF